MTNTASKDILARLLATENVNVQHANVPTASFNVRDRILTLPIWEDMQDYTYDHLVGHEVGHALFTPEQGWHDSVCDRGMAFKSYLNVVEDARIEKLIQRRYPGLRRSFLRSYKKMLKDGFFGVDVNYVNSLNLIDRINVYFKCGASIGVEFANDELPWLERISNAEEWEDVVAISEELFAFCREKYMEQKQQQEVEEQEEEEQEEEKDSSGSPSELAKHSQDEDDDTTDEFDKLFEPADGDSSEVEGDGEDGSDSDASDNTVGSDGELGGKGTQSQEFDDLSSKTEETLHENIANELSTSGYVSVHNFTTPSVDGNKFVFSYKNSIAAIEKGLSLSYDKIAEDLTPREFADSYYQEFHSQNKRIVDHMVKEFQMKKKAAEFARSSTSRTGVIDTVKMNNYLFEDDIFRKVTVVPEGKNHGILIFLDWSTSMCGTVFAAVQQMCLISMFCRKAEIPFRVFIFTNETSVETAPENRPLNELYDSDFSLREIFCTEMRKSEFRLMIGALLSYGAMYDSRYRQVWGYTVPREFYLCGTPLDSAIMYGSDVHREFKKKYRLDKTSTFFITDGASNPLSVKTEGRRDYFHAEDMKLTRLIDTQTKKQYRLSPSEKATNLLLKVYRDRTGSETIGYFLTQNKSRLAYEMAYKKANRAVRPSAEEAAQFVKNGYATAPHPAYNNFFIISSKQMKVATTEMVVDDGASKGKIRSAFKKSQSSKKSIRSMVGKVIERVA